jgi:hypothetical protein
LITRNDDDDGGGGDDDDDHDDNNNKNNNKETWKEITIAILFIRTKKNCLCDIHFHIPVTTENISEK